MPRRRPALSCRPMLLAVALSALALASGAAAQSTWQPRGAIEAGTVRRLTHQIGRLWASTYGGVYRSDDGAGSWVRVLPQGMAAAADPADPDSALASADDGTVLFTRDGGRTCGRRLRNLPAQPLCRDLAADRRRPFLRAHRGGRRSAPPGEDLCRIVGRPGVRAAAPCVDASQGCGVRLDNTTGRSFE